MHPADDLYRLLLEREWAFQDKTKEVFSTILYLTDAIQEHLEVATADIQWISIDRIGVEIIVMVSIPNMEHCEYAAPGFAPTQLLTIILPESVVDTAEKDTIKQFLDETFDIRKGDSEDNEDLQGIVSVEYTATRILH
jgi:hypothetical protein